MKKNVIIDLRYATSKVQLDDYILNFDDLGKPFGNQDRNSLKLFDLGEEVINVKSFKIPNIINKFAYRFFRKSKAQRSYEYANKLLEIGVNTPQPIAYYEFTTLFTFSKSFYVSEHLNVDLTFRELTTDLNYPNHEKILRAFTRFTYSLHTKGVNFLDHSPGNTLIIFKDNDFDFYLVDLNRMRFEDMSFEKRMKNLSKLTIHKSMVEVMSNEYAKVSGEDESKIFNAIWNETQSFQVKYNRRRRLKKKLKFWKSSR